jgi:activator of HSP90 ATPase
MVYQTWLDPLKQGAITESMATVDPRPDGRITLWGGVVTGKIISMDPPKEIVQTWRTVEFPKLGASSKLRLQFLSHKKGTRIVVSHEDIPPLMLEQFRYAWEEFYFPRLQVHFIRQLQN